MYYCISMWFLQILCHWNVCVSTVKPNNNVYSVINKIKIYACNVEC